MKNTPIPKVVADEIRRHVDPRKERFFLIPVHDGFFKVLTYAEGDGIHVTGLDVGEIIAIIRKEGCDCFMIAHNHPKSPFAIASEADIRTTKKIYDRAESEGLKLLDHIIVTDDRYMSFMEDGIITAYVPRKENRTNNLEIID